MKQELGRPRQWPLPPGRAVIFCLGCLPAVSDSLGAGRDLVPPAVDDSSPSSRSIPDSRTASGSGGASDGAQGAELDPALHQLNRRPR
ncbi:hypothetical protein ACJRO7_019002 [Eucalyptus globulus]|uniref:Secreted protein n=1 Tax=Eucalyptus globulus TaxID=34317 RepID=A0ABD3KWM7_EUCGL